MRLLLVVIFLAVFLPVTGFSAEWLVETLDNGLTVLILENHQVPQVNISTAIGAGAKNESDYFDGATHFLEHLILFRGTEEMTGEELGDAMKRHGAYFNGFTSSDWTNFVISLPKENLDFGLKIHADMLFRSNFPEEEMNKERHAVLEEINITEDNPFLKAYRSSLSELYGNHPYSKNVLGTKENISSVSRDSIYAYYKRYYAPNNMSLAVVGDFDAASALEVVKKYFGAFPRGADPVDRYSPPPKSDRVREVKIVKDVSQAYLLMSMLGPKADNADLFAVDIMAALLGRGQSSRLWKKLKDETG
ncbi:MAG: insulinase family protein, partial [candidate division Zixibacteria bacterium]|nr:insulinase family protein [candidate division Zixibacteria bacterium]